MGAKLPTNVRAGRLNVVSAGKLLAVRLPPIVVRVGIFNVDSTGKLLAVRLPPTVVKAGRLNVVSSGKLGGLKLLATTSRFVNSIEVNPVLAGDSNTPGTRSLPVGDASQNVDCTGVAIGGHTNVPLCVYEMVDVVDSTLRLPAPSIDWPETVLMLVPLTSCCCGVNPNLASIAPLARSALVTAPSAI